MGKLRLFNTLTGRIEEFIPREGNIVRIYACGPTVYDYPHIGNLRTFVTVDLLHRYLKYKGYKVILVMNITDVDDKTIRGAQREGIPLKSYTEKYTQIFFENLKILNILPATYYPRATEHIEDMVKLIQTLMGKGYAYKSEDGIYFDVSKFKEYGKLSKKFRGESLMAGASGRVSADEYDKEEPADFALWKYWKPEDGEVFWETPIGKGRPGWHIECSVMSMKYLGETLDIHCGGVDLIFPHHENEIAQSESATGKPFSNYWFHIAHLIVNGEKMSKSKGNYYTLKDLLDKGYKPSAIRWTLLSTHYQKPLDFSEEKIKQAENVLKDIHESIALMKRLVEWNDNIDYNESIGEIVRKGYEKFEDALDENLNISLALAQIFEVLDFIRNQDISSISSRNAKEILDFLKSVNEVLGVMNFDVDKITDEEKEMIRKREEARKKKDFNTADKIREELKSLGIRLIDTKLGTVWIKDELY